MELVRKLCRRYLHPTRALGGAGGEKTDALEQVDDIACASSHNYTAPAAAAELIGNDTEAAAQGNFSTAVMTALARDVALMGSAAQLADMRSPVGGSLDGALLALDVVRVDADAPSEGLSSESAETSERLLRLAAFVDEAVERIERASAPLVRSAVAAAADASPFVCFLVLALLSLLVGLVVAEWKRTTETKRAVPAAVEGIEGAARGAEDEGETWAEEEEDSDDNRSEAEEEGGAEDEGEGGLEISRAEELGRVHGAALRAVGAAFAFLPNSKIADLLNAVPFDADKLENVWKRYPNLAIHHPRSSVIKRRALEILEDLHRLRHSRSVGGWHFPHRLVAQTMPATCKHVQAYVVERLRICVGRCAEWERGRGLLVDLSAVRVDEMFEEELAREMLLMEGEDRETLLMAAEDPFAAEEGAEDSAMCEEEKRKQEDGAAPCYSD